MDDFDDDGSTESQRLLDRQLASQKTVSEAGRLGAIGFAKREVLKTIQAGADSAAGRQLLGELDDLADYPENHDADEVEKSYDKFVSGQGAAPVAPSGQAPAPSAEKKAANLDRARKAYHEGRSNEYPG